MVVFSYLTLRQSLLRGGAFMIQSEISKRDHAAIMHRAWAMLLEGK